jgi:hypothetical protein
MPSTFGTTVSARVIPLRHDRPLSVCPARMLAGDCTAGACPTEPLCTEDWSGPPRLQWGYIKASAALRGRSAAVQLTGRGGP